MHSSFERDEAVILISKHLANKKGWSKSKLKKFVIEEVKNTKFIHKLVFESFTEKRYLEDRFGTHIENEDIENVVESFDEISHINIEPSNYFKNYDDSKLVHIESTHTEKCKTCDGKSKVECILCNDSWSALAGRKCDTCVEKGKKLCADCVGSGRIERFKLTVLNFEYRTHYYEYNRKKGLNIPNELLANAVGNVILKKEAKNINKNNIDKEVDSLELKDIAIKFVDRHEDFVRESPNTRILKQRLSVIEIPVIECIYSFNDNHGVIYLYDNQKKVYLPNELVDKKSKCSIS